VASRSNPARRGAAARSRGSSRWRGRLRWLVIVFVVLALAALAIWPNNAAGGTGLVSADVVAGTSGPLVIYGLLLVAVLLLPRLLGPLGRIAGLPFRIFRNEERLARSSLARDRSRTALTVGALVVRAGHGRGPGDRGSGCSQDRDELAGRDDSRQRVADLDSAGLHDRPIRSELAAVPGVRSVSPVGLFGVPFVSTSRNGNRTEKSVVRQEAAAIVGRDYLDDGRLNFVAGDRTAALTALDSGGAVVIPKSLADEAGIKLGDTLQFAIGLSTTPLRVSGIVAHSIPAQDQEAILIGWSDALADFGVTGADFYAVRFAAGQESTARPALDKMATSYALEPNDLDRVSGTVGDALDRIFRLLDALALMRSWWPAWHGQHVLHERLRAHS